jgi:hypothetical protein
MPPKETWADHGKRWAPLIASLVLATTTVARVLGYDALADRVLGDVAKVGATLAAAGVAYGAGRKVQSQRQKAKDRARAGRLRDLQ